METMEIKNLLLSSSPLGTHLEEAFNYLSDEVETKKAKGFFPLVQAFRSKTQTEKLINSYSDICAIDLLYFSSAELDGTPWKARQALLETLESAKMGRHVLIREESLAIFSRLGHDFEEIEDVAHAMECDSEASLLASLVGQKDLAMRLKKREIDLSWRYEEGDRKKRIPTKEALLMQFGRETGKLLFAYESSPHEKKHDPIETSAMYNKLIDQVNAGLYEYFSKNPTLFSEKSFVERKKKEFASLGLEWNAPTDWPDSH